MGRNRIPDSMDTPKCSSSHKIHIIGYLPVRLQTLGAAIVSPFAPVQATCYDPSPKAHHTASWLAP